MMRDYEKRNNNKIKQNISFEVRLKSFQNWSLKHSKKKSKRIYWK